MNPDVISLASATGARKNALKVVPLIHTDSGDYYDVSKYSVFLITCERTTSTESGILITAEAIDDTGTIREVVIASRTSGSNVFPPSFTRITATVYASGNAFQVHSSNSTTGYIADRLHPLVYANIVGVKSVDSRGMTVEILPISLRG